MGNQYILRPDKYFDDTWICLHDYDCMSKYARFLCCINTWSNFLYGHFLCPITTWKHDYI